VNRVLLISLVVIALSGADCKGVGGTTDAGGTGNPENGSTLLPGSKFDVEVGTGNMSFQPIGEDSTVMIVCGPQGGQHIWTSIRAAGIDPSHAQISLSIGYLTAPADGGSAVICGQSLNDVTLSAADGWQEFAGIICFIPHPAEVDGQTVVLTGTLTDSTGVTATATVRFKADGPGKSCALQHP
jgi:hypothetical protein